MTARTLIRAAAIVALIATQLGLSACGFRPIYAQSAGVTQKLSSVSVQVNDGRSAYLLRQATLDSFGAGGAGADYTLQLSVQESRRGFGITAEDIATRFEVLLSVQYALLRAADGAMLDQGAVTGAASFDVPFNDLTRTEDPYSAIAVEENAKERAAALAADRLRALVTLALQT